MYGTVRTVVWEDGGREAASYPMRVAESVVSAATIHGANHLAKAAKKAFTDERNEGSFVFLRMTGQALECRA